MRLRVHVCVFARSHFNASLALMGWKHSEEYQLCQCGSLTSAIISTRTQPRRRQTNSTTALFKSRSIQPECYQAAGVSGLLRSDPAGGARPSDCNRKLNAHSASKFLNGSIWPETSIVNNDGRNIFTNICTAEVQQRDKKLLFDLTFFMLLPSRFASC